MESAILWAMHEAMLHDTQPFFNLNITASTIASPAWDILHGARVWQQSLISDKHRNQAHAEQIGFQTSAHSRLLLNGRRLQRSMVWYCTVAYFCNKDVMSLVVPRIIQSSTKRHSQVTV